MMATRLCTTCKNSTRCSREVRRHLCIDLVLGLAIHRHHLGVHVGRLGACMMGGARPGSGRKLPNIDERRAFYLHDQGMPKKQIAEKFNVPYKSLLTIFRKAGRALKRGPYNREPA